MLKLTEFTILIIIIVTCWTQKKIINNNNLSMYQSYSNIPVSNGRWVRWQYSKGNAKLALKMEPFFLYVFIFFFNFRRTKIYTTQAENSLRSLLPLEPGTQGEF